MTIQSPQGASNQVVGAAQAPPWCCSPRLTLTVNGGRSSASRRRPDHRQDAGLDRLGYVGPMGLERRGGRFAKPLDWETGLGGFESPPLSPLQRPKRIIQIDRANRFVERSDPRFQVVRTPSPAGHLPVNCPRIPTNSRVLFRVFVHFRLPPPVHGASGSRAPAHRLTRNERGPIRPIRTSISLFTERRSSCGQGIE